MTNKATFIRLLKGWWVCLSAALFFFYEFIQMAMLNVIGGAMMQDLSLHALMLGLMASSYFVANVIFLFFAGAILDRYRVKTVLLIALLICIIGTALLAMVEQWQFALFYRFLTGIGSAFCFLSVVRLATRWFKSTQLALVVGAVVTVGMFGGVASQAPMRLLLDHLGWRGALWVDALLGLVIAVWIAVFVEECPRNMREQQSAQLQYVAQKGYWYCYKKAFSQCQNWVSGFYSALMNFPIIVFGGLWGGLYLTTVHHLSLQQAPWVTQMLFFGTMCGSPLFGALSDRIGNRKYPMVVGAVLTLLFIVCLWLGFVTSFLGLTIFFFMLGFFTSTQVLSYSLVAQNAASEITAVSVSVVNISVQGMAAVFDPLFGWIMDQSASLSNVGTYTALDFNRAMWLFPICIALALLFAWKVKEQPIV